MTQQELYKELEATCLFGQNIVVKDGAILCGMFQFEHIDHGIWRITVEGEGESQTLPAPEWVEVLLLDFFADALVRNWFPNAHMLEYHKKWSLSEGTLLENDDGCWTLFVEGEVIENGVLYNCVTRLMGICEANV